MDHLLRFSPCKLWTSGGQPGIGVFSISKHSTQQFYIQSSYGQGEINPAGKETECREQGPLGRDILSESFHRPVHCSPRHAGSSEVLDSKLAPCWLQGPCPVTASTLEKEILGEEKAYHSLRSKLSSKPPPHLLVRTEAHVPLPQALQAPISHVSSPTSVLSSLPSS